MHLVAFLAMWILSICIFGWWGSRFSKNWWTTPRVVGWGFVLGTVLTVLLEILIVVVTWAFHIALIAVVLALVFSVATEVRKAGR